MLEINKRIARTWSRFGLMGAISAVGILDMCKTNPNICLVSADTSGLDRFKNTYPDNYYSVGIAEQNMIGVSAGLASEGNCVFATAYASFLTSRAHEFIRQNLGYLQYNVKLLGFSSGVAAGTSGVAHWSIDDLALMRAIPGLIVLSPADAVEAVKMVEKVAEVSCPAYIKLSGGKNSPIVYEDDYDFQIGKAVTLREGADAAIIATGLLVKDALDASELLQEEGISCTVIDMHTIKPLDHALLDRVFETHSLVVTVEEHSIIGGLGGAVAEYKATKECAPRQIFMGITDEFKKTGTRDYILGQYGLNANGIAKTIQNNLK